jgi:hypothetical protein
MRYLNSSLGGIVATWKTSTVDLSTTKWFTIPYENFSDKRGWFFEKEAALKAVLPQKIGMRKTEP